MSASHMAGCVFAPRSVHTKDHHKNGTNCLPAWHTGDASDWYDMKLRVIASACHLTEIRTLAIHASSRTT